MAQGALTAASTGEGVVPASEHRAALQQSRELKRLLGKTLENEILREAVERVTAPKSCSCARPRGRRAAGERSRLTSVRLAPAPLVAAYVAPRRRGRPPLPDAELLAAIQTLDANLPT
jgi:hypothetical protein